MRDGSGLERRRRFPASARALRLAVATLTGITVGLGVTGTGLAMTFHHQAQRGAAAPGRHPVAGRPPAAGRRMALMREAAREFRVPVQLLLAISYNQTRWQRTGNSPSIDGGYGLMDLTAGIRPVSGRGENTPRASQGITPPAARPPLDEAARLLHLPTSAMRTDERQNIRGAAALLAHYARGLARGALPASLAGWYVAVAEYSDPASTQAAQRFADDVYRTLRRGASLTTSDGQFLDLRPSPGVQPDRAALGRLGLRPAAGVAPTATTVDCPAALHCSFVPAAYAQNSSDPSNYGNYDHAGRPDNMLNPAGQPVTMKISYIIIHDTEGSYNGTISTFQNPASYVSANYVIRSSDGAVTEMVHPHAVSWGAANWYVNMHAINIENEGFAAQGATWYTEAMYKSDASLVRYLAAKYNIPLDREHILGHDNVPGPTDQYTAAQHWDPGPFWNWNHFMALVHGVSDTAEQASGGSVSRGTHHLVTIDPTFATNEPTVTDCSSGTCVMLPRQPASFVYLRTGPGNSYPLVGDPLLHPGGGAGTTEDSDWGDKASIGQTFVYAGRTGNWTAIWFAGGKAWFHNPTGSGQAARYTGGEVITPIAGRASIPVYGAAYPEASAYPAAIPVTKVVKLSYTIPAGQEYPTTGVVPTDYYYAATIHSTLPDDHTVVIGNVVYDQISFGHRSFFVKANDVTVQNLS